jgi:hypothetical protein
MNGEGWTDGSAIVEEEQERTCCGDCVSLLRSVAVSQVRGSFCSLARFLAFRVGVRSSDLHRRRLVSFFGLT